MKVLFLCGVFAKENEEEILRHAKRPVEYSANVFQEKLIAGFRELDVDFSVLSAPFIGSYPNASDWRVFRGFEKPQDKYRYVSFRNMWGLRNYSRAKALKQAIREFAADKDPRKLIVAYSPHTPFVQAAAYAKKLDPRIKICLVVPDLPQYMNLNAKISMLYKVGKKYDIAQFNRYNRQVDCYVLLTDEMKHIVNRENKPYLVVEGIVDGDVFEKNAACKAELKKDTDCKYIVYTGKLYEKFGVKNLVDAFLTLPNENYRLVLCGRGDLDAYVAQKAKEDSRILVMGQVKPETAREWVLKADVLVNPRANDEEYTKYSFPSKNIEYLASGNPVVAYMLDGMPRCYTRFIHCVEDDLAAKLREVLDGQCNDGADAGGFAAYARENLEAGRISEKIIEMAR